MPAVDSRTAASRAAVEQALAWYVTSAPAETVGALPVEQAAALAAALRGDRPFSPELFEALSKLGQFQHRLARERGAPACNLGDALTAFAAVPPEEPAPPGVSWRFEPHLDREAYARLGFAEASRGIADAQRTNREGWWAHAQRSRAFITEAAARVERPGLAVVLGAGQAFDLPLVELATRFERLVLVDIDEAALGAVVRGVFKDPGLRAKVEPRALDLTGVNGALVRAIDEIVGAAAGAAELEQRLGRLARSYRLPGGPALLAPGERADLLVSAVVLSQIAWPQRTYAARRYAERFGPPLASALARWNAPWWELELRLQQDHLNALTAQAGRAVLTCDVVSLPTARDAAGAERPTGRRIFGLGVEELGQRIPRFLSIEAQAAWPWARYQPDRRGGEGARMEVEAMVLREG
jgi:hypothetical protein